MIAETFLEIYIRDLDLLKTEITLYKSDEDIWRSKGEVKNSAGTLTLHLAGNLKYFIGAVLGNSGYVRQRDKEFSDRNISKEKLLLEIEGAMEVLKKTLSNIKDDEIMKTYPADFSSGKTVTTLYVLARLISHFNYHLGQINYHRRLTAV